MSERLRQRETAEDRPVSGSASLRSVPARGLAERVLALQRTAGNAAVNRLLQRKPLIASDYKNLKALKQVIDIRNIPATTVTLPGEDHRPPRTFQIPARVAVSYPKAGLTDINELSESTVTQAELKAAAAGGFLDKAAVALAHPELVWFKSDLEAIEKLSFVKKNTAGSAIGHVTDAMLTHIKPPAKSKAASEGRQNMLLHVFGQAVITTLFGRAAADLAGDIHERDMASLISGAITPAEAKGAIDNYVDLINNVYGQQLGAQLATSVGVGVGGGTTWDPALTTEYLNAAQRWISREMGWKMSDFTVSDSVVVKFTALLNEVSGNQPAATTATPPAATTPTPTRAPPATR
jgi:hypothetical protein